MPSFSEHSDHPCYFRPNVRGMLVYRGTKGQIVSIHLATLKGVCGVLEPGCSLMLQRSP